MTDEILGRLTILWLFNRGDLCLGFVAFIVVSVLIARALHSVERRSK